MKLSSVSRRAQDGGPARRRGGASPPAAQAFTLLEVMIALALFFMAVFAILDATAQGLRAARSLQINVPDISALVADFALTNRLEEGITEGDFGDLYPDFAWSREVILVATNGLFQVDCTIVGAVTGRPYQATTSVLLWRPDSGMVSPGLRR